MSKNSQIQVALVGNPNTGKTSLFNQLTGLKQKVGNYPGITVEKKQGKCKLPNGQIANIIDLPGTYSINPTSLDETIVLKALTGNEIEKPNIIIIVAEVENLKRNLLLFSQVKDLKIPTVLVINMADQMKRKGISIDITKLQEKLKTDVLLISARNTNDIGKVKEIILKNSEGKKINESSTNVLKKIDTPFFENLQKIAPKHNLYELWLMLTQNNSIEELTKEQKEKINTLKSDFGKIKKYQHKETIYRYQAINEATEESYKIDKSKATDLRSKLDKIFTHKVFGYAIFFGLLFLIFQSVFDWASVPMDFIDEFFANMAEYTKNKLPQGMLTSLITEGIIPGVGGVVIFIPQIAILFLFVSVLEETGYMSRVVFLMDKIMRKLGMNGKSIIPLISGTACAIPAIMATRTITSWKERLITILVTPFTTCSARLPVYAILIALIIPDKKLFGFWSLQGLTMLTLYLLGFVAAIISSYILHKTLKIKSNSLFVIEMPDYKLPSVKNVFIEVVEKTKAFVIDAGRIILAISIVLWFLASHGPKSFNNVEQHVAESVAGKQLTESEIQQKIASEKLEKSYIGIMGKAVEPVVKPLGYDWKIGIGLIASFAAREVFVGTLATIYSIGDTEDQATIKQRMEKEINANTGEKRFNFATGVSLLLFYAFSMQCMATLAIVKRETNSWKWPMIQLIGMGILAYITAFLAYQILQ